MTNMKALPLALASMLAATTGAFAQAADFSEPLHPKAVGFSFEGPFGTYDRAAWQRGFQVYKEVCSACHSLSRVAFHDLTFGFSEAQAKALAAGYKIPADPNDKGETTERGSRARQQWRRAAAGLVADRQGARGRGAICLFDRHRLWAEAAEGFRRAGGQVLQPVLRRRQHLHAAAAG
jgi:ubiquinol-cytochrome c reductase cytochrome c1 subunit